MCPWGYWFLRQMGPAISTIEDVNFGAHSGGETFVYDLLDLAPAVLHRTVNKHEGFPLEFVTMLDHLVRMDVTILPAPFDRRKGVVPIRDFMDEHFCLSGLLLAKHEVDPGVPRDRQHRADNLTCYLGT